MLEKKSKRYEPPFKGGPDQGVAAMSRLARQIEAYRMARRIVRACNRMKAGQGVALQWCTQQRHVLHWMVQRVEMGLRKREGLDNG